MVMAIGCGGGGFADPVGHLAQAPRCERKPFSIDGMRQGYTQIFANPRAQVCYGADSSRASPSSACCVPGGAARGPRHRGMRGGDVLAGMGAGG
jgi:hypothetical protein